MIIIKKILKLLFIIQIVINSKSDVYAYYYTNDEINNSFHTSKYSVKLDSMDGIFIDSDIRFENDKLILPTPYKEGHSFLGYGNDSNTNTNILYSNVINNINEINNKNLYAVWDKNTYVVNYYLDNELIFQRQVKYDENIDNININYLLDKYHKFDSWINYSNNMPASDVNLYANITDSHCKLISGHGPYSNALGLRKLFNSIGYHSSIRSVEDEDEQYLVETDYSLTLEQFEDIKDDIEEKTNYTSYFPYPYLYWLGVLCDNGYNQVLTRNVGQLHFN